MSSRTLLAAESVSVITVKILSTGDRDLTGFAVDESVEVVDGGLAGLLDEPFDHAPMEGADQLGMGLGELAERAVRERR